MHANREADNMPGESIKYRTQKLLNIQQSYLNHALILIRFRKNGKNTILLRYTEMVIKRNVKTIEILQLQAL